MTVRSVSYGAGVQSTALLALAAKGEIDFRLFIFANVGDDSEHPASLAYFRDHARPFAEAHGIEMVEVQNTPKRGRFAGRVETLYGRLTHPDSRSLDIPVRMTNGAPGTRKCTADFKIRPVARNLVRSDESTMREPTFTIMPPISSGSTSAFTAKTARPSSSRSVCRCRREVPATSARFTRPRRGG